MFPSSYPSGLTWKLLEASRKDYATNGIGWVYKQSQGAKPVQFCKLFVYTGDSRVLIHGSGSAAKDKLGLTSVCQLYLELRQHKIRTNRNHYKTIKIYSTPLNLIQRFFLNYSCSWLLIYRSQICLLYSSRCV